LWWWFRDLEVQERKEEGQRVVVVVVLSSDEAATQATQPDTMMTMTRQLLAAITRSDGDKQRLANQPHGSETYLPIKRRGLKEESTYKAIAGARESESHKRSTHAERRREGEGALRQHSGARGRRPTTKEPKLLLLLFVSLLRLCLRPPLLWWESKNTQPINQRK